MPGNCAARADTCIRYKRGHAFMAHIYHTQGVSIRRNGRLKLAAKSYRQRGVSMDRNIHSVFG